VITLKKPLQGDPLWWLFLYGCIKIVLIEGREYGGIIRSGKWPWRACLGWVYHGAW
jgi:hypothetical protein